MKNDISIVIPYYNSVAMIPIQLQYWNAYTPEIKKDIKIIIVDDGSEESQKVNKHIPQNLDLNLEIYEIQEDIPWNECGANNLGCHVATSQWIFRNDFDWLIPVELLKHIATYTLDPTKVYNFNSQYWQGNNPPNERLGIPPNILLFTKDVFFKSGGYDEDFRGHHGCDMLFRHRLAAVAPCITYPFGYMEAVLAGSGHTLARDATESYKLLNKKISGEIPISKDILRFTWKRVR